ncbi:MAG: hypothetical protein ACI8XO_004656 [Verrucomicrobiales bacterium]|jgi:hypothetical protein
MTTKGTRILSALALASLTIFLCQCSVGPVSDTAYDFRATSEAPQSRMVSKKRSPSLGTTWGEARDSRISNTEFVRATSAPVSSHTIHYNSESNIPGSSKRTSQPFYDGTASIGIKSSSRYLKARASGTRKFVIGEYGDRYTIYVKNHTNQRIEVVLSVDGLDVLDGKSASTRKRGYVIAPRGKITVEGFRRSYESVAAFRFGSAGSSYAGRTTGSTRNVGVIGAAIFREKVTDWDTRKHANPFPGEHGSGQFSHPPQR